MPFVRQPDLFVAAGVQAAHPVPSREQRRLATAIPVLEALRRRFLQPNRGTAARWVAPTAQARGMAPLPTPNSEEPLSWINLQ
jgi:hypothetical protein